MMSGRITETIYQVEPEYLGHSSFRWWVLDVSPVQVNLQSPELVPVGYLEWAVCF